MARPQKRGLDYFSHDTNASTSREVEYLEAQHGLIGYAIYLKILEKVYGHEGYFLPWTEIDQAIFAKRLNIQKSEMDAIIETCFDIGLFSRWVYDANHVLTSAGIQRRFLQATEKRIKQTIKPEHIIKENISDAETNQKAEKKQVSASESTQSKVKESKEEKRIKTSCASGDARLEDFERFWGIFGDKRGREKAWAAWKKISGYKPDLVESILSGAKKYTEQRPSLLAKNGTPKMAQGWLTDKRWEDEVVSAQTVMAKKNPLDGWKPAYVLELEELERAASGQ